MNDYKKWMRTNAACAVDITSCENCGANNFSLTQSHTLYCMANEKGELLVGERSKYHPDKIECAECGLEHHDWQFVNIVW